MMWQFKSEEGFCFLQFEVDSKTGNVEKQMWSLHFERWRITLQLTTATFKSGMAVFMDKAAEYLDTETVVPKFIHFSVAFF